MFENRMFAAFVEDADFIKLREITVSYSVPTTLASRFGASSAILMFGARNLATWTDFSGPDPEMNVRGSRDEFIANNFAGAFAPPRTYWLSVTLSF